MEPDRGRGDRDASRRKPDVPRVLEHLDRRPALGDVAVPFSAVWEHQLLARRQLLDVAHAYVPTPPPMHFGWRSAARRERQRWGPRGW